ncbi:protein sidekick-2 [Clonorchis sinensis]|uniref:Protein sidekick-2 n=1 Tax=Clonorchis sinensis TaxID=79923 RepID=H2KSW3_CLOSI|nr:protein sidekick-2 [Clonorchis sinensis]
MAHYVSKLPASSLIWSHCNSFVTHRDDEEMARIQKFGAGIHGRYSTRFCQSIRAARLRQQRFPLEIIFSGRLADLIEPVIPVSPGSAIASDQNLARFVVEVHIPRCLNLEQSKRQKKFWQFTSKGSNFTANVYLFGGSQVEKLVLDDYKRALRRTGNLKLGIQRQWRVTSGISAVRLVPELIAVALLGSGHRSLSTTHFSYLRMLWKAVGGGFGASVRVPTLTDDPEDVIPLYFMEETRRAIVIEGESVTLPCQTNVKNGLKTLWIKDRQTLRENITFSFRLTSINRADHGMYRCAVFNDRGGILSKQLAVDVGYLDNPPYNSTRTLVDIPLGESIVFWPFFYAHSDRSSLTVSPAVNNTYSFAFPPPQARWTINNAPVTASPDVYISSMEQALVLLNVDRNMNFKVVRAQLTNGYGPMTVVQKPIFSRSYIIQTKEPPPNRSVRQLSLILAPKDVTITLQNNESGSATFECVFNARPAGALRVQWFRKRIGNGPYEQFEPISLMHQNSNLTETKHHRTHWFDPSGFNRSMTVQNIRLSNLVGYSEEYICQGYLLDSSLRERGQSSLGSHDLVSSSTEFTSGPLSATARLWIHTPPVLRFGVGFKTITSSFKNGRARAAIVEGVASSDTKMVCTFENYGHPNSTIGWLKNAKKVSKNDSRIFVNSDHQLVITHLKIEDAGIYQCHAQNSAGEDMLAFWLKVTSFGPQLLSGGEEETELTVLEETKTYISCPIIGAPRPVYNWSRAGRSLYIANHPRSSLDVSWLPMENSSMEFDDNQYAGIYYDNNRLHFTSISLTDAGLYRCSAVNYLGQYDAYVKLFVKARTRAVVAPPSRLSALMNDSLRLECVVLAHGQTRVQFNWLHGRPKQEHKHEHNEDVSKRKFISGAGSAQKYSSFDIAHFNRSVNVSSSGGFTEMQYGSVLTVERLSLNDAGIYVCQVISSAGNMTFNTEVAVFSPPSPPYKFRILYDEGTIKTEENASALAPGNLDLEYSLADESNNPPTESLILFAKETGTHSNMSAQACNDIKEHSWSILSLSPVSSSPSNLEKFTVKVQVKELLPSFSYCFAVASANRLGWSELAYQENLAIFIPFQGKPTSCRCAGQRLRKILHDSWIVKHSLDVNTNRRRGKHALFPYNLRIRFSNSPKSPAEFFHMDKRQSSGTSLDDNRVRIDGFETLPLSGCTKTYDLLRLRAYWPEMRSEVVDYVVSCKRCQLMNGDTTEATHPMEPIPVSEIGELWSVDIMGLSQVTTSGAQYIMIITKHLSQWVEVAATTINGVAIPPRLPINQEIGLWPAPRLSPEELGEEMRKARENLTADRERARQKTASRKSGPYPIGAKVKWKNHQNPGRSELGSRKLSGR